VNGAWTFAVDLLKNIADANGPWLGAIATLPDNRHHSAM
jgi:hypothetical protein